VFLFLTAGAERKGLNGIKKDLQIQAATINYQATEPVPGQEEVQCPFCVWVWYFCFDSLYSNYFCERLKVQRGDVLLNQFL